MSRRPPHYASIHMPLLPCAQGADPWATDRCGMRTALHYAAMRGRLGCAEVLLGWMRGPELLRCVVTGVWTTALDIKDRAVPSTTLGQHHGFCLWQ